MRLLYLNIIFFCAFLSAGRVIASSDNLHDFTPAVFSHWLDAAYVAQATYGSEGDLEKVLGLSQSALSQHLAVLRREKLVSTRRNAQSIFYCLDSDDVKALMVTLYERFCSTSEDEIKAC